MNEAYKTGRIEALLEKPHHVIDLLPRQVPPQRAARFFAAEPYLLTGENGRRLREKMAAVLTKLGCYTTFLVCRDDEDEKDSLPDPAPELLAGWIRENRGTVNVLLPEEDALIAVPDDSTCMTVYNADEALLALLRELAYSEGLFLWKPQQSE